MHGGEIHQSGGYLHKIDGGKNHLQWLLLLQIWALLVMCLVRSQLARRISDANLVGALACWEQLMPRCLATLESLLRTVEQLD